MEAKMDAVNQIFFLLATEPTREQQRTLCKVLWRWKLCSDCDAGRDCRTTSCPWQRSSSLEPFFAYYRKTASSYVPYLVSGSTPALGSHDDLIALILTLKLRAGDLRSEIAASHFAERDGREGGGEASPQLADQNCAVSLAARVIAMVNTSVENTMDGLEGGMLPMTWQEDTSFADYLQAAFPVQDDVEAVSDEPRQRLMQRKGTKWPKLTAKRLKKMAGLELVPTDNLQNHLRLDLKYNTVEIYHHTNVLKENLISSLECDSHDDVARGVSEGNIPRDLALETLVTIKEIMFPFDSDSQSLLRTLVAKKGFDPDCVRADSRQYRRAGEKKIPIRYWSSRLDDLYDQMETPLPSGYFERWLERRSGARYVMMATLGGVVIAVILGALGLAVSIFQAWVGYQQWKHPVNPS